MEFKTITINKTNILDVDCIYRQIVELTTLYTNHKHVLADIRDFPTTAYNDGKILSIVDGNVVWADNPSLPSVAGLSGKYLSNNGTIPVWVALPIQLQSDWNITNAYAVDYIKNKPNLSVFALTTYVDAGLLTKVDKVTGKQLSTEDYSTTEKSKLATIAAGAEVNVNADWNATTGDATILNKPSIPSITGLATVTYVDQQDNLKVDKVTGKGLSTEDYTTTEKTKLSGIAAGAEVNIQADWNEADNTQDDFIKNKPATFAPSAHNHDDRYYTETEIDSILAGIGGVEQYNTFSQLPVIGNANKLYITRTEDNTAYYWSTTATAYKKLGAYINDFIVSLSGGKRFLKWDSGQTVPAANKTAAELLREGAVEAIAPTLYLTYGSATIQFNQTAISNIINFTRVINSLGATVASASLSWRRNNSGSWTDLSTSTANGSVTHSLTDSAFNTQPFNYRYILTDSSGGTATIYLDVTPTGYAAPSISFSAPALSLVSPESNTIREIGNTPSSIQGSTSISSPLVNISSYQYAVSVNGGAYTNIGSSTSLGVSGGSFTTTSNTQATSTSTSITYRVAVVDAYTTSYAYYTIILKLMMFYGPVNVGATLNSATVRSLSRRFADAGSPFSFASGTTERRFIVSFDTAKALTLAKDIDNNIALTSNFVLNSFNVNDAAGNAVSYKNYVYTNAINYSTSVTIQITYI